MWKSKIALLGLVALVGAALAGASARADDGQGAPRGGKELVGYYIQWGLYGRGYTVKNVETSGSADRLTVLNYAFGNVAPDASGDVVCQSGDPWADYGVTWDANTSVDGVPVVWGEPLRGNFQQLRALKALHPRLKVLMSLGGWTWSKYFSDAALTTASRQRLVSSCIDLFLKGNLQRANDAGGPGSAAGVFDGFDIDWEWPGSEGNTGNHIRPEDRQNFTALLAEFRRQLKGYGESTDKRYLLTAFLPAAPAKIDAGFEVNRIFRSLDFATVQGYDLHGAWESVTNHQSNLFTSPDDPSSPRFSVADTVAAYLRRGAPARELVVGAPFYSRGWTGVAPVNFGLYQPAAGPAPPISWFAEPGVDDYKAVKTLLAAGYTRHNDFRAGASWLYDPLTGTFWTYDDPLVMTAKALYVRAAGLGGVMFWELSGDTADGELVRALAAGLGGPRDR
jgi:chitinase